MLLLLLTLLRSGQTHQENIPSRRRKFLPVVIPEDGPGRGRWEQSCWSVELSVRKTETGEPARFLPSLSPSAARECV